MPTQLIQSTIGQVRNLLDYWGFRFSIRPSDVFLVSFPKSGTTWLSFLMANVLKDENAAGVNLKNSTAYIPDVNKVYLKRTGFMEHSLAIYNAQPSPRIFKVHSAYDPHLPRVVYVLRDPRDVMLSYWHYHKMQDKSFSMSLKDFIEWDRLWPCGWDEHVHGWLEGRQADHFLLIKYEDLKRDPHTNLRRVLNFAGIPCAEEKLHKAVDASSFENMRKIEDKYGAAENIQDRKERFVRKGVAGGWRKDMDAESLIALETRYAGVMRQVGYETAALEK